MPISAPLGRFAVQIACRAMVEALNEDIAKHGSPEIMNTDQGSQFTGSAWITTLTDARARISMDDRGRNLDNIFNARLWRSLKQEAIYLEEIDDGFNARCVIKNWMAFHNTKHPMTHIGRAWNSGTRMKPKPDTP